MKPDLQQFSDANLAEIVQAIFSSVQCMVILLDADGRVTYLNRYSVDVLGWSYEEILGRHWIDEFIPPEDRLGARKALQSLERGEGGGSFRESGVQCKNGSVRRIAWSNCAIHAPTGSVSGIAFIGMDRTEEYEAQRALQEEEDRLRTALENMVDGFITIDERGTVDSFNAAAERIFGYSADEVVGRNVSMLMPEPDRSRHDQYIENYKQTGEAKIIGIGREVEGMRKDGSVFPLRLSVGEMRLGSRRMFVANLRDLSEENRLRMQLYQSEKLSAVGQLAAGIAHEIGGPLSVISGNAELLLDSLSPDDPRREDVDGIAKECDAVTALVRRILDFSRPSEMEAKPVHLNECLRNILFLVQKQISKKEIEIKLDLQVGLPAVYGDANQLEQVVMNLLMNAWHSMPEGGKLEIRSFLAGGAGWKRERRVGFQVEDSGVGIPAENLGRIFDPFFTTRGRGEGTGLGLAITHRIVTDHQGSISVRSRVGRGTVFTVEFPAMEEEGV